MNTNKTEMVDVSVAGLYVGCEKLQWSKKKKKVKIPLAVRLNTMIEITFPLLNTSVNKTVLPESLAVPHPPHPTSSLPSTMCV